MRLRRTGENFNPRPREEGDYSQQAGYQLIRYFNPRPREEGDDLRYSFVILGDISIHALVKRATFFDVSFNASYVISIHALVKRATCGAYPIHFAGLFQSTPS